MKVLRGYIFKELLVPFGLSLVAFTFVILMNKIIKLTEMIVNKGASLWTVILLFSYTLPMFLVLAIPCTVLIASQAAIRRLSTDNETTALFSSGISFYQILPPVFLLSVFAFFITLGLMIYAVPYSNQSFNTLLNEIGQEMVQSNSALDLRERVFYDELSDMVIYVDKIPPSGDKLTGVLVSNYRQGGDDPQIITAKEGRIISYPGSLKLTISLLNGSIHNIVKTTNYRKIDFDKYELKLDLGKFMPKSDEEKHQKEMTVTELRQVIADKKAKGLNSGPYEVELYKKFAIPFACLLLGFVGAPLGLHDPRRSTKSVGFIFSVGMILIYYVLLRAGENLGSIGKIPALPAVWLPNLLLMITGIYLVYKTANQSPIKALEWINSAGDFLSSCMRKIKEKT